MTTVNIKDFGASTDLANNASAIQNAIDSLGKVGGTVEIPAGVFQTGTLFLRNHTELRIEKGATLKGSPDMQDYPGTGLFHNELGEVKGLIIADQTVDTTISGEGTIDFNGQVFFDYSKPNSPILDVSTVSEDRQNEFAVRIIERPTCMIFYNQCQEIRMSGVHLKNAACWDVVLSACDDVQITKMTIRSDKRIPNDDGIHLVSCRNVVVADCDIYTGDDCIAVTGINDFTRETNNIVVTNCILSSSSAGIRIGYWRSKVRNVQVSNCAMYETGRGILINAGGAGYVKDVTLSNIQVSTHTRVGHWWGQGEAVAIVAVEYPLDSMKNKEYDHGELRPNISGIQLNNINAKAIVGLLLVGDNDSIQDVAMNNSTISVIDNPNKDFFNNQLDMSPLQQKIDLPDNGGYWLYADHAKDLELNNVTVRNNQSGKDTQVLSHLSSVHDSRFDYRIV